MARIDAFLKLGLAQGCSDIHLAVGIPPMLRLHGDLMPIKFRDLGDTELEGYIDEILTESQRQRFRSGSDLDFSYVSGEGGRFRVNVFRKVTGIGATFRNIPSQIPSLDSLGLPPVIKKFCDLHQGMVLVTGSTGTGKSTTLAAMIDYVNTQHAYHIVTVEDPIEYTFRDKRSVLNQREIGFDTMSFAVSSFSDTGEGDAVRVAVTRADGTPLTSVLYQLGSFDLADVAFSGGHGFTGLHYVDHEGAQLQFWCGAE